ncbi:hypothetical protein [Pseudomonas aeruginosa]|uniref:hypothetical protein n=1 Tax=Pseudomonas aeruginosa TaxID=287 RepID=UPI0021B3E3DA|nr:hypothetical protein [Pseudomonas aeruginosa]MCT7418576.1 hypothetical protein [Pseudomonas aeruginosa]
MLSNEKHWSNGDRFLSALVLKAIEDFFKWAQDAFDCFWGLLPVLPEYVFHKLVSGIEVLPVAAGASFFAEQVTRSVNTPSVVYFASTFQIGPGVTMVPAARICCDSSSGVSRLSVEVMYGD